MLAVQDADLEQRVAALRHFNRIWTGVIRVLDDGLLETPYSLTEARVIYELAQVAELDLLTLRRDLGLDPGYLSRMVGRFKADGLVEAKASPRDGRRQIVRLTDRGREVFDELDRRSARENAALLGGFSEREQRRMIAAMTTIRQLVEQTSRSAPYRLRGLQPGDLGWVIQRHGVVYAEEYEWDETFEGLVARILADYADGRDPRRENAWIAELGGAPVGCVFVVSAGPRIAKLRLLLVEPRGRGIGIGAALVDAAIGFARHTGYRRLTLWTNDVLTSARRIYEAAGFKLVDTEPHRSFGRDLVSQTWDLEL